MEGPLVEEAPVHNRDWDPASFEFNVPLVIELGINGVYRLELELPRLGTGTEVAACHQNCLDQQSVNRGKY